VTDTALITDRAWNPWIAGERSMSSDRENDREILDPARATKLATVPDASAAQVHAAIAKARACFDAGAWSRASRGARGDALIAIAERLREHAEELALLDSLNVGKPIGQAEDDAAQAADFFDQAGRVISTLTDELIDSGPSEMCLVVREPVGVVAAITPWNFPAAVAASVVAPALAAGNSVVLKPSPETPLSALRIAELSTDLLPPGALSVVPGGTEVGRRLSAHEEIDRIAFTGSTRTGREIMDVAAKRFKRVGLELGGKSPTVVFEDAPLEDAARSALARFTLNQGENCSAGTRLIVQDTIAAALLERVVELAAELSIGDPQDRSTNIGPMISAGHLSRVHDHLTSAASEAKLIFEGPLPRDPDLARGFFSPVSIWEAGTETRLWREEVFGPVLACTVFHDEDHAVALANDSDYGLMAVIWTGDRGRGIRVARRIRAGIVRINAAGIPTGAPWGGFKASGIGRSYGRYGIEASSELKQINVDLA
jgi:acyl-CoA reductase-like NAD-dependent aldehyde dehydrogenase